MKLYDLVNKYGEGDTLRERITSSLSHIFDFPFPIFDILHKQELEEKIVKRYLTHDCFTDDEEMFNLELENWLNIKMPGYNKLYESCTFNIRPLINNSSETVISGTSTDTANGQSSSIMTGSDNESSTQTNKNTNSNGTSIQSDDNNTLTRTSTENTSATTNGKDTVKDNSTNEVVRRENDTPNGQITSLDDGYLSKLTDEKGKASNNSETNRESEDKTNRTTNGGESSKSNSLQVQTGQSIDEGTVITNGEKSHTTTNTTENSNSNTNTQNSTQTYTGLSGISESELLMKYREALINVDEMIINEMKELFVLIY